MAMKSKNSLQNRCKFNVNFSIAHLHLSFYTPKTIKKNEHKKNHHMQWAKSSLMKEAYSKWPILWSIYFFCLSVCVYLWIKCKLWLMHPKPKKWFFCCCCRSFRFIELNKLFWTKSNRNGMIACCWWLN